MSDVDAVLDAFLEAVRDAPMNLVSRRSRGELATRHIPESVAFAAALPAEGPVLDVGTGGGLPGMVIAITRPDLEVHLLDATAKKTAYLMRFAVGHDIPVTIHTGRAEDLAAGPLKGQFGIVTARAVAALYRLIPMTVPFLRAGGTLYAIKGETWKDEVAAAAEAIKAWGLEVVGDPQGAVDDGVMREGALQAPRVVMLRRSR